jgi:hypothetical protein
MSGQASYVSTWPGWEAAVLNAIGAPVNDVNVAFLDAWQTIEGGGGTYNPLETTQSAPGATNVITPSGQVLGVKNYPNSNIGAMATAQTLQNGLYNAIVNALKAGTGAFFGGDVAAALGHWAPNDPTYARDVLTAAGNNIAGGQTGATASQAAADSGVGGATNTPTPGSDWWSVLQDFIHKLPGYSLGGIFIAVGLLGMVMAIAVSEVEEHPQVAEAAAAA